MCGGKFPQIWYIHISSRVVHYIFLSQKLNLLQTCLLQYGEVLILENVDIMLLPYKIRIIVNPHYFRMGLFSICLVFSPLVSDSLSSRMVVF